MVGTRARLGAAILLGGAVLTSSGAAAQDEGNWFTNLLRFGGTTVPPSAPPNVDAAYCPPVDVADGGAAMQSFGGARTGDQAALRSQISLGQLARECTPLGDGSVAVKVGVEGRALLGPGGSAGRFEAPVRIVVKNGETVVATRARRVSISIPSGANQGTFAFVEEGITVPARFARDYEIEVGLGGAVPRQVRPPRARARPPADQPG